MKKILLLCAAGLCAGLVSTTALAQAESQPIQYLKKTKVIFTDKEITGKTQKPGGVIITTGPKLHHRNLIIIRTDFRDKIARSVHNL